MRLRAPLLAVPLCLALPCAGAAAAPRPGEDLTVLGFSADGARFAAVIAAPGEPAGTLRLWDARTGRAEERPSVAIPLGPRRMAVPPATLLSELGLGDDAGTERYASGTPLATRFESRGAPVRVAIEPPSAGAGSGRQPTAAVSVRRARCATVLDTAAEGRDFNLVNVLESRDGGSLAVVYKFTQGAARRYGVVVTRLADGPLGQADCPEPASAARGLRGKLETTATSSACLDRLRGLAGRYTGAERIRDAGGKDVPLYRVTIEAGGALSLYEGGAAEPSVCGRVVTCRVAQGELVVSTRDAGGACDDATLRVRPRPGGGLELEYHGFSETYLRERAGNLGRSVGPGGP